MSDSGITPLVRDHQHALVASVERRVHSRSDAEDIVQEAWIRALAQLAEAEGGNGGAGPNRAPIRSLKAWLHRIAINLSIDHLRRRKVRAHLEAGSIDAAALEVAGDGPLPDARMIAEQQQKIFLDALRQLPVRARRVLVLSRVEGWTYPRIAAELNISVRTVSNDLERAIAQCLILLAGYES